MPRKLKYSSNIKDKGLLGKELKTAAELYCQGNSYEKIVELSINENVFQVNTERRRKEMADCIVVRMKYLDDFSLRRIAEGTIFLANTLSLYAMMKTNPLVYDFMNEVYREKAELMINRITDADMNQFMDVKAQQIEAVANWTDGNKEKVRGALRNALIEAGALRDMCYLKHRIYSSRSQILWQMIRRSLTECIIIYQAGKFLNLHRSTLQITTDL